LKKIMSDYPSLIVTVRTADERTEKDCIQSALDQGLSRDQIVVIHETPFKRALETCFQVATQSKAIWLLTLDADMLLLPGVLAPYYREAEKMPDHFIQIQGQVYDKFYGEVRRGGPRLYRVQHLEKAYDISRSLKDHIRPETNIIQRMGKAGHPARYISPAIALHDVEQYYADIYRKACVYAEKHIEKLPTILKQAVRNREADPDYQVILKGIYDSMATGMDVRIDKRMFKEKAERALTDLNLDEKDDLEKGLQISRIIDSVALSQNAFSFASLEYKDSPSGYFDVFKETVRRNGILRTLILYFGLSMSYLGNTVEKFGKR